MQDGKRKKEHTKMEGRRFHAEAVQYLLQEMDDLPA